MEKLWDSCQHKIPVFVPLKECMGGGCNYSTKNHLPYFYRLRLQGSFGRCLLAESFWERSGNFYEGKNLPLLISEI